jgi:hypothetical protein
MGTDMNEAPMPIQRMNADLGWFFSDATAEPNAEATGWFTEAFLTYLGRVDTANIKRSGESAPTTEAVIVFSSHNAVYIPPNFFADPDDPSVEFNGFLQTSAGSGFSNWSFERDSEVFATENARRPSDGNNLS